MTDASDTSALDALLERIGWTRGTLARRIGVDASTVDHWGRGRRTPDARVVAWLVDLAAAHDARPMPDGWTPRGVGRPSEKDRPPTK